MLNKYAGTWYDPNAFNEDSKENYNKLVEIFGKCQRIATQEELKKTVDTSKTPIILISSGGAYAKIKQMVEEHSNVEMIIIFCQNVEAHHHYCKEHIKVRAVVNKFDALEEEIKKGYLEFLRYSNRFVELYDEKSFFKMGTSEEKFIYEKIGIMKDKYEGQSVFFPFAFATYTPNKSLWEMRRLQIEKINESHAWHNLDDKEHVRSRLKELKAAVDNSDSEGGRAFFEKILQAYTKKGLYYLFNLCLRTGVAKKVEAFREYAYALRGSMFLLGSPINAQHKKAYRGS